jgi:hypothetical protein
MNAKTPPSNRDFGLFLCGALIAFSAWFFYGNSILIAILFFLIAVVIVFVSFYLSYLLAPFNRAWSWLGLTIGKIVNPIVLTILFVVLIVPVGLIGRLFGRDVLILKKPQVSSYWIDKTPVEPDSFRYQF